MGSIWLGSLPDVLRSAGLPVSTWRGWETRSRRSGGYDALRAVQIHHTASQTTPQRDMAYMWDNAPTKPIGALYLDRTGHWTVGAAGATNTSGRGGPVITTRGQIPLDAGNRFVLSIEAANSGTGERWPVAQQRSYVIGVNALCRAYGLNMLHPGDLHAHFEYTPRKIDPAGPSIYSPDRRSWNMTQFRNDAHNATPIINPEPEPEEDMYLIPPPPERPGGRWLVKTTFGYRLADSHDVTDNLPRRPFTDGYRVQQYDECLAVASNRQVPA